ASPSPSDDNILMDDDAQRPAGTDAQRRLDIEIASDELIAGARTASLCGFADGADQIAFALAPSQFGSDAEQGRERDALQELPRMAVDLVGQAHIALRVGRRNIVDPNRRTIGQDDPLPDDERATLTERDDAVVTADQPRALGYQQMLSRHAVIDIF